jgi:Excalibur calcium-binding domain
MSFDPKISSFTSLDSMVWSDGVVTNEELYLKLLEEERQREWEIKQLQEAELLRITKENKAKSFKLKVYSWAGGLIIFTIILSSYSSSASSKVSEAKAFTPVINSSENAVSSNSVSRVSSSTASTVVASSSSNSVVKQVVAEVVKSQGVLTFEASPTVPIKLEEEVAPQPFAPSIVEPIAEVTFSSCTQAHAAGYYRILRGQPGYSTKLDRDKDGIACE